MLESQVRSLGWEDPLEEGMATHSSILAWRIPWTEKPGGLQFMRLQRVGHDLTDLAHMHAHKCLQLLWKADPGADVYVILIYQGV